MFNQHSTKTCAESGVQTKNKQTAYINTHKRLKKDANYKQKNRKNAVSRHRKLANNELYKESRREATYKRRYGVNKPFRGKDAAEVHKRKSLKPHHQRYWMRRSQMIREARLCKAEHELQQWMMKESHISPLAIIMLFKKCKRAMQQGSAKN